MANVRFLFPLNCKTNNRVGSPQDMQLHHTTGWSGGCLPGGKARPKDHKCPEGTLESH